MFAFRERPAVAGLKVVDVGADHRFHFFARKMSGVLPARSVDVVVIVRIVRIAPLTALPPVERMTRAHCREHNTQRRETPNPLRLNHPRTVEQPAGGVSLR